jgi:hypothetical protein
MKEKIEVKLKRLETDIKITVAILSASIIGFVFVLSYNGIL